MRAALWFLGLFGIAVAVAVFAGNNDATVTLYWSPYRVDLSLNFVILALVLAFALTYAAMRTAALLFALPVQAKRWRALQKERAINAELFNAQSHFLAGRYIRSQKSALSALSLDKSREHAHPTAADVVGNEPQLRALAHVMAAQSAHALQDTAARDSHLKQALDHQNKHKNQRASHDTREGTQLLAASWALDDRDASGALSWLARLPSGAARRTLALRLKLKAAQLNNQSVEALETTRLLAKHHAFSKDVAPSLIKSLVLKRLDDARDAAQLQAIWRGLDVADKSQPDIAIRAAYKLSKLNGNAVQVTEWLLPSWQTLTSSSSGLDVVDSVRCTELIEALEAVLLSQAMVEDRGWLVNIEKAQIANPRDPRLQYLAGMACKSHQLWGKAQQQLTQAAPMLKDIALQRRAWCALAELAEQRGESNIAASAWKKAALV
jgi:HemY protein